MQRSTPAGRRGLFSIPFKSSMTDADLARLQRELDLVTYLSPKPGVSGASPGIVQLDFWSGLFLARGAGEGEWVLEAHTWGNPPAPLVHDWHVRAAVAAHELDPTVEIPQPLRTTGAEPRSRPSGRDSIPAPT